eukprot:TRINITY_DN562_c0_g1_i1.p1 TRINITY_DN562_c0_g1~~TRINITY_DN562_c0_g1_i1.p1  ORF type:complete len:167 (-),score=25.63 TRINITY_DN562_c0_g1_i1:45-545(-)
MSESISQLFVKSCILPCDIDLIETLLLQGANINELDSSGENALIKVCYCLYEEKDRQNILSICKLLIRYGIDVNLPDCDGTTCLITACENKFLDLAVLLIDAGADVKVIDENLMCPLLFSIINLDLELYKLLLENGASYEDIPHIWHSSIEENNNQLLSMSNLSKE